MQALLEKRDGGIQLWHIAQPDVTQKLLCGLTSLLEWLLFYFLGRKTEEELSKRRTSFRCFFFFFLSPDEIVQIQLGFLQYHKEKGELKFMQQDIGFLTYYCM